MRSPVVNFKFRRGLWLAGLFLATGCASIAKKERLLSEEEIHSYGLSGTLHSAELCPHRFDHTGQRLIVSGPCEIISCEVVANKTVCRARPK